MRVEADYRQELKKATEEQQETHLLVQIAQLAVQKAEAEYKKAGLILKLKTEYATQTSLELGTISSYHFERSQQYCKVLLYEEQVKLYQAQMNDFSSQQKVLKAKLELQRFLASEDKPNGQCIADMFQ